MRYGFVIDQRKCIGCHACTVACKQENGVALGDFRTWVKYTEKGSFPSITRSFLIERCNHCDDAPCVDICPVEALWRRDDGIVDFSGDRCIGCKACMAACPYDAIYIDPDSHTVGKCNYCAHRVDVGLQPACVNVCPVEAIITGDLDNPTSQISQLLSLEPSMVRRPEKGTKPKLFYLGADGAAVNAEATSERHTYLWGEPDPDKPIRIGESGNHESAGMVQRDYAVHHQRPWGWHVSTYLWTKSISAGALLVAALLFSLGGIPNSHALLTVLAPVVSLLFLGATNLFLVLDLERPERFWRVMLWPHWRSWLVKGAYILVVFGALVTATGISGVLRSDNLVRVLFWPTALLAVGAAVYTAFLLRQATGRDFWQSPLLAPHLIVQAFVAGSATLIVLATAVDRGAVGRIAAVLAISLILSVILVAVEVGRPHRTAHTRQAIRNMTHGESGFLFWSALVLGMALPAGLALWTTFGGTSLLGVVAGLLALAGLAFYEDRYVWAGQSVPQS
jgi:Fe-S-cluster-containing dehydrogenase component/formate-dependent nitrite reductase membrane component NrfD